MGSGSLVLSLILYLAAVSPRRRVSVGASQILGWTSPSPNSVYGPGDTIIGGWTSDKQMVSPAFSLCTQSQDSNDGSAENDCGETVWPSVDSNGDRSSFSLMAHAITSDANFYLRIRMKEDFGNVDNSPTFSLSPSAKIQSSGDSEAESASDTTDGERAFDARDGGSSGLSTSNNDYTAQAPFNYSSGDTGDSLSSSTDFGPENKTPHTVLGSGTPVSSRISQSTMAVTGPVSPAASPASVPAGDLVESPDSVGSGSSSPTESSVRGIALPQTAITSHTALPTAAVAAPLSLVAVTLLASVVLCLAHRRSLAARRVRNAHLIDMQRSTAADSAYGKAPSVASSLSKSALVADPDIEKTIGSLYGYRSNPSLQEHVSKRDPVVYTPPHYPVPRQDVRTERMRTYDEPCERPHDREYARSYIEYSSSSWCSFSRYRYYPRSPPEKYTHSFPEHVRQYSTRRGRHDRNDDCSEGDASTTDSILNISPELPTPQVDSYYDRPRTPPRTHSRHTAQRWMTITIVEGIHTMTL
ncbi:hypothetical protein EW145_g4706 [Phellinidium pouzarii]|uniref:Uncharacterized protein n=1 Tax=Phellinidium pouzarii TaxID=167371 RepID=A0A4S4L2R8_9AGAM|nr:hypothetical protein EW145_g4706 [Phellinidium pouzarii]